MLKGVLWCEDGNKSECQNCIGRCSPALAGFGPAIAGLWRRELWRYELVAWKLLVRAAGTCEAAWRLDAGRAELVGRGLAGARRSEGAGMHARLERALCR
jgi:hypothetical protein